MKQIGKYNTSHDLSFFGFTGLNTVRWNLSAPILSEIAVKQGEGQFAAGGALVVETGQHTGRSAADKFVVRDETTEDAIWWDNNKPMSPEAFELLKADMLEHAKGKDLFAQDLRGGADEKNSISARVVTEFAWHSLFIRNLLIRPQLEELANYVPDMMIIDLPSFKPDPAKYGARSETIIACDLVNKVVLIAGTSYAGEMKKSVFTALNYSLPEKDVMPMHCSANVGDDQDSAVFFGLSGTGKTTLSADASRTLIGDDEHGWGEDGIYNFEGGCYAKTINLSAEAEPEIYATTQRFGTILENVILNEQREPDFEDVSLTQNTRCAYPLDFIPNASKTGKAPHPKNIIMLTADAFGVMPPISRLTSAQAMFHFLSGYTAKVAGTEKGVTEPEATFSTCFGAPFMPRHPAVYGDLLRKLIAKHDVTCWLVNTGWTGGAYGTGSRMPIKATRKMLSEALNGNLNKSEFRVDENFGFEVPTMVDGVDTLILDPRSTWADKQAYDLQASNLVSMFSQNFEKFEQHVDSEVLAASGKVLVAAQ
ncbi:MAG: phosphoenolpyruvate carboxykinase [Nitratireductor sp.]